MKHYESKDILYLYDLLLRNILDSELNNEESNPSYQMFFNDKRIEEILESSLFSEELKFKIVFNLQKLKEKNAN